MPVLAEDRYTIEVRVRETDIDELGHASNLVFVRWVLEAARAHSAARGLDTAAYRELGAVFVVRRHEVDYLRPAFAEEDIAVTTWVESWRAASSVRRTELRRGDALLAAAATTWAFVDFDTGRPRRIPADVRSRF